jgi:hypothetical protein
MAVIDLKRCVVVLKDGTSPTAKSVTAKISGGTLTYNETRNREYVLDRGNLSTVREGDQVPMDVSFDFQWEFLKSDTGDPPSIEDVLKKRGEASTWVSTDSDSCADYCIDIEVTYTPNCAGEKKEIYLFPDFRHESLNHDFMGGKVSCSGKCNATEPTITRIT